jgi:hypothetical protein
MEKLIRNKLPQLGYFKAENKERKEKIKERIKTLSILSQLNIFWAGFFFCNILGSILA